MKKQGVRIHVFVMGRVQGVLYRKGAQKKAQELGVTGFAHNAVDGSVELIAEGENEKVEEFAAWCKKGTRFARVDRCDIRFEEYKNEFDDFSIREFGF